MKMTLSISISIYIIFFSDLNASNNCGIFVNIKKEELLKHFLENILQTQNSWTLFKSHQWFIFTKNIENLKLNFRFDSQVYVITVTTPGTALVYETYSIDGVSIINRHVGDWTADQGLGENSEVIRCDSQTRESWLSRVKFNP